MAVQIRVRSPSGRTQTFHFTKNRITIGRLPENDLHLRHNYVSGRHCRIEVLDQRVFIRDLGSTNGTLVNGQPLQPHLPHPLQRGDIIQLGPLELIVEPVQDATIVEDVDAAPPRAKSPATGPRPSCSPAESADGPSAMWQLQTGILTHRDGVLRLDDNRLHGPRAAVPGPALPRDFRSPFPVVPAPAPAYTPAPPVSPSTGLVFQAIGMAVAIGALLLLVVVLFL